MLNRLRIALVTSYVGAIGLGYLLAQALLHISLIFASPVASWLSRREYPGLGAPTQFFPQDAIPELIKSVVLLLVGYGLLRWLYFKPIDLEPEPQDSQTVASES
jgi:hypothetical protein